MDQNDKALQGKLFSSGRGPGVLLCSLCLVSFGVSTAVLSGIRVESKIHEESSVDKPAKEVTDPCPQSVSDMRHFQKQVLGQLSSYDQLMSEIHKLLQCASRAPKDSMLGKLWLDDKSCLARPFALWRFHLLQGYQVTFEDSFTNLADSQLVPASFLDSDYMDSLVKVFHEAPIEAFEKKLRADLGREELRIHRFESKFPEVHGNQFVLLDYETPAGRHLLNVDFLKKSVGSPVAVVNGMLFPKDSANKPKFFRVDADVVGDKQADGSFANIERVSKYQILRSKEVYSSCISCHVSGYLPILPKVTTSALEQLNREMTKTYFSSGSEVALSSGLPLVGDISERSDEELRALLSVCYPELDLKDSNKVDAFLKKLNCASCHDGEQANALNTPSLTESLYSHFIEQGRMPPKSHLSEEEAKALSKCLMTEFIGTKDGKVLGRLQKWLTAVECQ